MPAQCPYWASMRPGPGVGQAPGVATARESSIGAMKANTTAATRLAPLLTVHTRNEEGSD